MCTSSGTSLCPTLWERGRSGGTHQGCRWLAGFLQSLSQVAYLSTVVIQLALQLLPPDSLEFQLSLQLLHSPAKSKGDKRSIKHIQACPGYSTCCFFFFQEQVSHSRKLQFQCAPGLRPFAKASESTVFLSPQISCAQRMTISTARWRRLPTH